MRWADERGRLKGNHNGEARLAGVAPGRLTRGTAPELEMER